MAKSISIGDLKHDQRNPRKHNPRNLQVIVDSLHDVGFARSIVIDEGNEILAGNGVIEAAALAGIEKVVEVEADGNTIIAVRRRGLTDEQKQRLKYFDNRSGELADWDAEQLLADLDAGLDLAGMFRQDELDALLEDLLPEPEVHDAAAQIDRAAELQQQWGTSLGQLWQLGDHRLIVGDCTDADVVARVMDGERAAVGFHDPPYGIEFQSNARTASKQFVVLEGDDEINGRWIPAAVDCLEDAGAMYVCTRWDVFAQWKVLVEAHIRLKNVIVWDKVDWSSGDLDGDYSPRHEFIFYCVKGRHLLRGHRESNVWNFGAPNKQNYLHPTQKKVEVPAMAIEKSSDPGDIVTDWFLGSGTTLIACEQLSRKCRAVEISPGYVAVALQRYQDSTGKTPVLVA